MKRNLKKLSAVALLFVVMLSSFCPCTFAQGSEIKEINVTLPTPQTGEEIYGHKEIVLDNKNCRVGMIAWFSAFNGIQFSAKSDVFLPQYEYSLIFDLQTQNEGDYFAEDCVVKVNGESVRYFRDDNGDFVIAEYSFGKPEGEYFSLEIILQSIKSVFAYIKDIVFGFRVYNLSTVSVN